MVDTYYDNGALDAAKTEMAIRFRKTSDGRGQWNLKPNGGFTTPDGVTRRLEFAVDANDDQPATIKSFVDSTEALNPFFVIRDVVPGATPSEHSQTMLPKHRVARDAPPHAVPSTQELERTA
jgi:hypothetical protein